MANANESLTGKKAIDPQLGSVVVLRTVPASRVLVSVKVTSKGKGWNESKQRYDGIKTSSGWYRGENREFGTVHEVNYKQLKLK